MKYQLIKTDLSPEYITGENLYSVDITIGLHPTDGIAPDFSKTITVESNNSQTGFEVDAQRELAINEFMEEVNG